MERYLEDVMCAADLAGDDERCVGAELREHLSALVEKVSSSNPKEIYAMLKEQFGQPGKVGRGIAAAKGRARTFFKKQLRRLPWTVGVGLFLAFFVRYAVAQEFRVTGDGLSPIIPLGSRVFVYKLAQSFTAGDVVVYRDSSGFNLLGKVDRQSNSGSGWVVERNPGAKRVVNEIMRDQIVGRVFLNTR
jgi:hypothetical protein